MEYEKVELISLGPSKPLRVRVGLSIPELRSSQPKPPPEMVGLSIPEPRSSQPKPPLEKVELSSPVSSSSKLKPPLEKLSPTMLATLKVVKERTQKRVSRRTPNVAVKYFDTTCDRYKWLLLGWFTEQRFVLTGHRGLGRIYKYYYDPTGMMYYTKRDVLFAWSRSNIIYID
ncbi:hypothetical protein V6N13_033167 [Hibiscus sabdariffa]|uniref:Uncharacterized protein n=1 Tax=Hibiscus sabdariffa TaxID=183260 RepID=A0ABR2FB78_9ROSI